jgi:hypothetical protein
MLKAETKAKRRATLSLIGMGVLDETEVQDIPGAVNPETGEIVGPRSTRPAAVTSTSKPLDDLDRKLMAARDSLGWSREQFESFRRERHPGVRWEHFTTEQKQDLLNALHERKALEDLGNRVDE